MFFKFFAVVMGENMGEMGVIALPNLNEFYSV